MVIHVRQLVLRRLLDQPVDVPEKSCTLGYHYISEGIIAEYALKSYQFMQNGCVSIWGRFSCFAGRITNPPWGAPPRSRIRNPADFAMSAPILKRPHAERMRFNFGAMVHPQNHVPGGTRPRCGLRLRTFRTQESRLSLAMSNPTTSRGDSRKHARPTFSPTLLRQRQQSYGPSKLSTAARASASLTSSYTPTSPMARGSTKRTLPPWRFLSVVMAATMAAGS